jgi:hypothetical protein
MSRGAVGRAVAREITARSIAAMNDMGFGDSSSEMSAATQSMCGVKSRLPSNGGFREYALGVTLLLDDVIVVQEHCCTH